MRWMEHERAEAKKRYDERPKGGRGNKVQGNVSLDFNDKGQSRDKAGERVGVSGKSIAKKPSQKIDEVSANEKRSDHKTAELFNTNRTYVNQAARCSRNVVFEYNNGKVCPGGNQTNPGRNNAKRVQFRFTG